MDRGGSATFLTELGQPKNNPAYLIQVGFDAGTIYLTDAYKNVTYGGNTYLARGDTLGFDGLQETSQLLNNEMTVTMTGCDQLGPLWVSLMLSYNWINRPLVIYKALLNANGDPLASPVMIFSGLMDEPSITDDPTKGNCSVSVGVTSQLSDFLKKPGRRNNNNEQQALFPGDAFFEFTSEQERTILWGGMVMTAEYADEVSRQNSYDPGSSS